MPLDIGECVNKAADSVLRAPFMHATASNPIYTAMLIVFVVMLIVLIVFRDTKSEDSILVMTLRSGFWIFIATLGIIFMHNKVLTADNDEKGYQGLFEETSAHPDAVPINIPSNQNIPAQMPSFDVGKLSQRTPVTKPQPTIVPQVSPVSVTISVPNITQSK